MGQEASLPAEGDDLEELAPPSTAAPSGGKKLPNKMMNMMRAFEQTARGDDSLQKMESAESGTKASLFRPTARGVISQMRSLRINKQDKKAEHAQDWEKQWYADDDEDDSDEEEDTGYNNNSAVPASSSGIVTPTNAARTDGFAPSNNHAHLVSPPEILTTAPRAVPQPDLLFTEDVSKPHSPQHGDFLAGDVLSEKKPDVTMFLPMLRVLGKGSFGKVVLVQKREGKDRGNLFAMKILKKTHLVKRRQIERTRTERKVLSVVNHPFIMKLHYAFQTDTKLYLVLDYCPGGELFFHLSRFRRFPERVARFYAAELMLAIGHLHKRGIIYRDLKPENVLLDADGHVKLGDFGLAKAGIQHPYEGATSMCGTPEYMAPEVLAQLGHGFCVDYWGLGMIVYEMMTGLPPWYTTDRQQLFRRLKSAPLDIPSYFSPASADFVNALLERNPRRRLGVTGIRVAMEHDYFKSVSWRSLYTRRLEAPIRPCEGWNPDSTDAQNFDAQFTRMPVESDDSKELDNIEELDENTFLGFSFDIISEKQQDRHRTQNAHLAPG